MQFRIHDPSLSAPIAFWVWDDQVVYVNVPVLKSDHFDGRDHHDIFISVAPVPIGGSTT